MFLASPRQRFEAFKDIFWWSLKMKRVVEVMLQRRTHNANTCMAKCHLNGYPTNSRPSQAITVQNRILCRVLAYIEPAVHVASNS